MTYADEEAGSPPSAGNGDGQRELHEGNGETADAKATDRTATVPTATGLTATGVTATGAPAAEVTAAEVTAANVTGASGPIVEAPAAPPAPSKSRRLV